MSDFKRENRYIVFKISDIERYLKSGSMAILDGLAEAIRIERALHDKEPLVCAVIESDWPEYEWVWGAIEARVSGESAAPISVVPRLVPSREDEIGWLIEFRDDHAPRWYEPLCGDSYVAVKALRFARKQDAETLIKALKMQNAFASQHLFVTSPEGNDHGNDDKREPHNIGRQIEDLKAVKCGLSEEDILAIAATKCSAFSVSDGFTFSQERLMGFVAEIFAPIPPTRIKDFSELRDELDAAPLPPTPNPSQQEALDALDNMDDYARMAGLIAIGPIETLRDFILARPDTEGSGK